MAQSTLTGEWHLDDTGAWTIYIVTNSPLQKNDIVTVIVNRYYEQPHFYGEARILRDSQVYKVDRKFYTIAIAETVK